MQIEEATIDALRAGMAAGTTTAVSLTGQYLERIAKLDKVGPAVNAVIELNPDAISIAHALDEERKAKGRAGRCTEFRCS